MWLGFDTVAVPGLFWWLLFCVNTHHSLKELGWVQGGRNDAMLSTIAFNLKTVSSFPKALPPSTQVAILRGLVSAGNNLRHKVECVGHLCVSVFGP